MLLALVLVVAAAHSHSYGHCEVQDTYSQVNASAGANGSVSPLGAITKDYGSSQLFAATPDTCYDVNVWFVDGSPVQTGGTTYTLSNITADHTVNVTFKLRHYTVTAGGPVSPASVEVPCGGSQLFTATVDPGYDVNTWFVDGSPVQTGGDTYTITNVTATHVVSVTFKIQTFSVTATAGEYGSISPSGTLSKDYGSSQLFTATPDTGHDVDTWYVDGSPVQSGGTTYTLSNITATHTVSVTFKIQT